jgi:protein O-GlcNAc transferase
LHSGDAAQLINNDGVHILINLNGYTKGSRNEIFALQPSPIQVAYLGYCGSMGADYIQYMLSDNVVTPKEFRSYYQEKVIAMPHSYFVADHKQSARSTANGVDMPTRAHYGVPEDKFVFCNFNQLYKIDPPIFDVWMRLLKRVPNSVLWLLRFPPAGEINILKEARKRGVREDQIIFSDVAPREEHVKRGFLADLFLDTPACNAHTTACDILWSGTPMLTMTGDKMATRVGASLLKAAGLEELITTSYAAYEDLAVALVEDQERLYAMRRHLEDTRDNSPAFDTARWVMNMEEVNRCIRMYPCIYMYTCGIIDMYFYIGKYLNVYIHMDRCINIHIHIYTYT